MEGAEPENNGTLAGGVAYRAAIGTGPALVFLSVEGELVPVYSTRRCKRLLLGPSVCEGC